MVNGLQHFVRTFGDLTDCFILIGGTACELWMNSQGLEFRATKDLDIVLVADKLSGWKVIELPVIFRDSR